MRDLADGEWKKLWTAESIKEVSTPYGLWRRRQRNIVLRQVINRFPKDSAVIELGCGGGTTLNIYREEGFKNSIGIDISSDALGKAERNFGFKIEEDVFVMDAKNMPFPDKTFDVVSQEGMWEHFRDYRPFIKEAARISKKWIVACQPDHFAFFGALSKWAWEVLSRKGVREHSYPLNHFALLLKHHGFQLVDTRPIILREDKYMVFKRCWTS